MPQTNPFDQFDGHAPGGVVLSAGNPMEGRKTAAQLAQELTSTVHTSLENRRMNAQAPFDQRQAAAATTKAEAEAVVAQQKADEAKAMAAMATMGPNSQVHGDAYLQRFVPPAMRETVKAYARGDLGSRAGGMSSSMLPIIQHAMNYDPTTSGTTFAARAKMHADLAGSQPNTAGGSLRAMERMLLHGQEVLDGGQSLNNFGPGLLGSLGNTVRTGYEHMTHDPAVAGYEERVRNYAPEAQKAIAQTTGGVNERGDREAAFSAHLPQSARAAALQGDARQAMDAMGAVNDQYRRLMGRDITDMLSPEAKAAYDKIMAGGYGPDGKPMHPAQGWTPPGEASGGGRGPDPFGSGGAFQGGGGGGGGQQVAATGSTRSVPVPAANAIINEGIRTGRTLEQTNAQLKAANLSLIPRDGKNDAAYNSNLDWIKQHRGYSGSMANVLRETTVTPAQRFGASAPAAFAGSMFNSALMGLPGMIGGHERLDLASQAHAPSAFMGNLVGGAIGAAGMEAGAGALAAKTGAAAFAPSVINGVAQASPWAARAGDTAFGAISGATSDPNASAGGMAANAVLGGGLGLGGGMFGRGVVAPVAARAFAPVARAANRTGLNFLRFTPPEPGLEPGPAQALASINRGPDVRGQLSEAARLNVPMTFADTSTGARALTGAAIRRSPDAAQLAENVLQPRARGQVDRFGAAVERHLGPVANIPQLSEGLAAQARTTAGPLYDAAYQLPGASSVPLDDLATRPGYRAGLGWAHKIAAEEGRDPSSLGFNLNDQGEVELNRVPSWQTLDHVKRGIDAAIEAQPANPVTGRPQLDTYGRALDQTRRELVGRLRTGNPTYANALDAYAGPAQERDALQLGQDAFGMTPDLLASRLAQRPAALPQAQVGFRGQLVKNANNLRDAGNPFDAASTIGTPNARERLGVMYPNNPGNADLLRTADLERALGRTNNKLLGNSDTAERTLADKAFTAGTWALPMAADAGLMAFGQVPVVTAGRAIASQGARDAFTIGLGKRAVAKADAIAPIMLNPDPAANISALDQMTAAQLARLNYLNRPSMRRRGGMFGAGLATTPLATQ